MSTDVCMASAASDTSVHGASGGSIDRERELQWLERIAWTCERAARGDLNVRLLNIDVAPESDLGRALHAINAQLDYMESFVREVKAVLACAAAGKHFRRVPLGGMLQDYRLAVESINEAAAEMQRKAEQIEQAKAERLAVADQFERDVQTVLEAMSQSAAQLSDTSRELANAATRSSSECAEAVESAERSVERIRHMASLTGEMHEAVNQIDTMAHECSEIAGQAATQVGQATEVMNQLQATSQSINSIVDSIMEIAKQTQLLSLNAAIEAARAGTAGAGFAIVATEIQKLSERTREATENAKKDIRDVQEAVGSAVDSIRSFGETIGQLNSRSETITGLTDSQQQTAGDVHTEVEAATGEVEGVTSSIKFAASAATETATASDELLDLSSTLADQANRLSTSVDQVLARVRSETPGG